MQLHDSRYEQEMETGVANTVGDVEAAWRLCAGDMRWELSATGRTRHPRCSDTTGVDPKTLISSRPLPYGVAFYPCGLLSHGNLPLAIYPQLLIGHNHAIPSRDKDRSSSPKTRLPHHRSLSS
ncbi:hypothetical protein J1614_001577 [Plenodomus biglobosus]|nr:hypothetical protein J1614_001577 [Plenodomus biglobosus]